MLLTSVRCRCLVLGQPRTCRPANYHSLLVRRSTGNVRFNFDARMTCPGGLPSASDRSTTGEWPNPGGGCSRRPAAVYEEMLTMQRRRRARLGVVSISPLGAGEHTHIVRSGNSNRILKRMPTHMQDLLVEIDLVGIRLFPHACPLPSR